MFLFISWLDCIFFPGFPGDLFRSNCPESYFGTWEVKLRREKCTLITNNIWETRNLFQQPVFFFFFSIG